MLYYLLEKRGCEDLLPISINHRVSIRTFHKIANLLKDKLLLHLNFVLNNRTVQGQSKTTIKFNACCFNIKTN